MKAQTKAMVDEILNNPPQNEDALRMACALHRALSMSVKLRVVILGAEPTDITEELAAIRALWQVITKSAEQLFPADAQDKAADAQMEDPASATDFTLMSEDGTKGVRVSVVSDEEMQAAQETASEDDEECDCPVCQFRVGLLSSLAARDNGVPSGNIGAMFDEDDRPDYSARPFWKPPVRKTFAVPGNNTIH